MAKEKDDNTPPEVLAFEKRLKAAAKKGGAKTESIKDLVARFASIQNARREEIFAALKEQHPEASNVEILRLVNQQVKKVLEDPLFERQIIETLIADDKLGMHKTGALTEHVFWEHVDALQEEYRGRADWHALNSPEVLEKEPFTLLALDIDHFKAINDSYGHDAGDEAILQLVNLIKSNLYVDDMIGSVGGDELEVLMKTDSERAAKKAEDIRKLVSDYIFIVHDNNDVECKIHLTVSVGISPHDRVTGTMKKHADGALYAAKGKSRKGSEQRAMRERNAVWIWGPNGIKPYAKNPDEESKPPPVRRREAL